MSEQRATLYVRPEDLVDARETDAEVRPCACAIEHDGEGASLVVAHFPLLDVVRYVGKPLDELTAEERQQVALALTGWRAEYRGPGQLFSLPPELRVPLFAGCVQVSQVRGIDI